MKKNYYSHNLRKIKLLFLFSFLLFIPFNVLAVETDIETEIEPAIQDLYIENPIINPSAAYCEGLGYEHIIKDTAEGQLGVCKFSDTEEAPAWEFLSGEKAQNYSYCNQAGYEMKIIDDTIKCGVAYQPGFGCLACILKDGSEVAAGTLLEKETAERLTGISEIKSICKVDGQCFGEENVNNCPQDCVVIESKSQNYLVIAIVIILIVIFIIIGIIIIRKRKQQ